MIRRLPDGQISLQADDPTVSGPKNRTRNQERRRRRADGVRIEFHMDCGHYGEDLMDRAPEGADTVEGFPYCAACWKRAAGAAAPDEEED